MKTVHATEATPQLDEVLDAAYEDLVMVEREGKEPVALMPASEARLAVLSTYAVGAILRGAAMKRLGLSWYGDLLDAMQAAGLRVAVPADREEAMTEEVERVLGAADADPKRQYVLADMIAECDPNAPPPADLALWETLESAPSSGLHAPQEQAPVDTPRLADAGDPGSAALEPWRCCMKDRDLIVMDAAPLVRLAQTDRLDLLLCFGREVYIPDEVEFEAVEKLAWERDEPLTEDRLRLRAWIEQQAAAGRVCRARTLIGEAASEKRQSGEYAPSKRNHCRDTDALAAHDFISNRDQTGPEGGVGAPALLLVDLGREHEQSLFETLDVLSTYSMLVLLEREGHLPSARDVWALIQEEQAGGSDDG